LLVERGITVLDVPTVYYAVLFEDPDGMKLDVVHAPGWI
jgi:glyoxylase I family protein